jgi:hypothetical protein
VEGTDIRGVVRLGAARQAARDSQAARPAASVAVRLVGTRARAAARAWRAGSRLSLLTGAARARQQEWVIVRS